MPQLHAFPLPLLQIDASNARKARAVSHSWLPVAHQPPRRTHARAIILNNCVSFCLVFLNSACVVAVSFLEHSMIIFRLIQQKAVEFISAQFLDRIVRHLRDACV